MNQQQERQLNALMTNSVVKALRRAGIPVYKASDDLAEILQLTGERIEYKKKEALDTAYGLRRVHHPTVVPSASGAKILKEIDKLIIDYKEKSNQSKTFIGDIAKIIQAAKDGSGSEYATFITYNDMKVTIRLSNHNATVSNFDYRDEEEGISIVIANTPNKGMDKAGDAHVVEFFYDSIKLRRSDGQPLVEILKSIKQTLYSGEYKDTTGLAQREEVNARFMKDKSGTIYGWTSNGRIYLTGEGMNPRTLMHEYTHLWANAMQSANPEGWNSIKSLLRDDLLWEIISKDASYRDIADDEDLMFSEILARTSEKDCVALLRVQAEKVLHENHPQRDYQINQLLFKMKEALNMIWNWVTEKLFNIREFQSKGQVSSRILYDMVNSTEIAAYADKAAPQYSVALQSPNERLTDIAIGTRPDGTHKVRCRIDGVLQMGEKITDEEYSRYEKVRLSGDKVLETSIKNQLAEKYFGEGYQDKINRGVGR